MKKYILISCCFLYTMGNFLFAQQPVPAPAQSKSILLLGAVLHIGNGRVIENAGVGFRNGKIDWTGSETAADKSKYDEVIQVNGKHIYPGIIAPNSLLGLQEISAVRATRDFAEVGNINPHVRSIIAYNTDSRITPTVRSNGVLIAQVCPRSGTISGSSSVVELDAWNWEDALLKADDGIHLYWPKTYFTTGSPFEPGTTEKTKEYDKKVNELKQFLLDAKAYSEVEKSEEKNLRFEAMKKVFSGTQALFIHADYVREMTESVLLAKNLGVKKIVLVGARESWMITGLLKENSVSVILAALHNLPERTDEDIDLPFKLPFLLKQAGILVCLSTESDAKETTETRNLPFMAGTAVKYGFSKEEALMLLTSNTAKILGIDNRVGTLEVGKDATLFISNGDALDMMGNQVVHAFVQGKKIDLDSEQKALYNKYKTKYGM